jgi:hypothetical protein
MKKLFSFLALVAMISGANCTRISENNDPVIGIWAISTNTEASKTAVSTSRQEWTFNDAYLGKYFKYVNKKMEFETDFKWSREGEVYTISYPGTDFPDDLVTMENTPEGNTVLQETDKILAIRE